MFTAVNAEEDSSVGGEGCSGERGAGGRIGRGMVVSEKGQEGGNRGELKGGKGGVRRGGARRGWGKAGRGKAGRGKGRGKVVRQEDQCL